MCLATVMPSNTQSTVISLRLRPELARDFKVEAASRGLKLNELFEEMLRVYRRNSKPENARETLSDDDRRRRHSGS